MLFTQFSYDCFSTSYVFSQFYLYFCINWKEHVNSGSEFNDSALISLKDLISFYCMADDTSCKSTCNLSEENIAILALYCY